MNRRPAIAPAPVSIVVAAVAAVAAALLASFAAVATEYIETPSLAPLVESGALPPVRDRLPRPPAVADLSGPGLTLGRHGGQLRMVMGKPKDIRQMVVYGYARPIGYDRELTLRPDLLESYEVEEGRIFTFRLREDHRWSDGHPFTAEDFRYWWEDVANNEELSPSGPPVDMLVDGEPPEFEALDPRTVRYIWSKPNPEFLARLAGANPRYIYAPAHYLKRFHSKYRSAEDLQALADRLGKRNWAAVHNKFDNAYKNDNPDLPSLQPWVNTTPLPSQRFLFKRNPYFHRVDAAGRQLPYIDEVAMSIASSGLVPLKSAAGESDLQARYLAFSDYTFLKDGEKDAHYDVRLWRTGGGSKIALFPNLNAADPMWRDLMRDVRFRRALSLAIDRTEINQAIYYGLAIEGNNTVLSDSPLYDETFRDVWARFDPGEANRLLDEIGLTERNAEGLRLLPNGDPLWITVETAGEDAQQTDVLQLIVDSWYEVGVKLFIKPSQREVFRRRIFAGSTVMSVWSGLENGLPTASMSPAELAPTDQNQYQWPKWGQYYQTRGQAGEPIDMAIPKRLAERNMRWRASTDADERREIWREMLALYADRQFSIGLVAGVLQPVVVHSELRNVPEDGLYNWDPGSFFGIYRPDIFWFDGDRRTESGG